MNTSNNLYSATEQPIPEHNDKPNCWEHVIEDMSTFSTGPADIVTPLTIKDMNDRDIWGRSKYKTPLQPFNGRDSLIDFYQEMLDSSVYLWQHNYETYAIMGLSPEMPGCQDQVNYKTILNLIRFYRTRIYERDNK